MVSFLEVYYGLFRYVWMLASVNSASLVDIGIIGEIAGYYGTILKYLKHEINVSACEIRQVKSITRLHLQS